MSLAAITLIFIAIGCFRLPNVEMIFASITDLHILRTRINSQSGHIATRHLRKLQPVQHKYIPLRSVHCRLVKHWLWLVQHAIFKMYNLSVVFFYFESFANSSSRIKGSRSLLTGDNMLILGTQMASKVDSWPLNGFWGSMVM